MAAVVTPIPEFPDDDPSTISTIPNITISDPKPVQYVWTKVPLHHDFYRHTFLSWARLRKRPPPPTNLHPEMTIIEKPLFFESDEIPPIDPLEPEFDIEGIKRLVNYISMMGITMALFTTCLIIGILSLIYSLQPRVPTGTILSYSGNAATLLKSDDQWLFCDGSAVSRTKYSALFLVIGTTYGAGNGIDTFNLPDLRSRFLWGSSGVNDTNLQSGGSATHTLTIAEIPSHDHNQGSLSTASDGNHNHGVNDPGHNHGGSVGNAWQPISTASVWGGGGVVTYDAGSFYNLPITSSVTGVSTQINGAHTHVISGLTGLQGGGQPFDKMPPYQTVHYIIRI